MKKSKIFKLLLAVVLLIATVSTTEVNAVKKKPILIAGNGKSILADGEKGKESIGGPSGITMGKDGKLYVTDSVNNVIRTIKDGKLETFVGKRGITDIYGEATGGYLNSTLLKEAYFNKPYGIIPYQDGFAITDRKNNAIRYIGDGKVDTIAGSSTGGKGLVNGKKEEAKFYSPTGITSDEKGNLYIADTLNHVIRKCTKDGVVTTYAGGLNGYKDGTRASARFHEPMGVFYANGGLYVSDTGNQRIRLIKGNKVTTIAGSKTIKSNGLDFEEGYLDGKSNKALFASPTGIVVTNAGTIFVADKGNGVIRQIKKGVVTTITASASNMDTYPIAPEALFFKNKTLYITDTFSNRVYCIKF